MSKSELSVEQRRFRRTVTRAAGVTAIFIAGVTIVPRLVESDAGDAQSEQTVCTTGRLMPGERAIDEAKRYVGSSGNLADAIHEASTSGEYESEGVYQPFTLCFDGVTKVVSSDSIDQSTLVPRAEFPGLKSDR